MALPQRRDPNEERRIADAERRRIDTEPAGGFGAWWLWLVLIIAIIWFAGWGWGGYGGWWWGRRGVAPVTNNANVSPTGTNANGTNATNNAAAVPTGGGVAILNAANKRTFVGQRVDIRDVRVQNKINDRALWIGNNNGNNGENSGNNGAGRGAGVNGTNGAAASPNATTGPGGLGANTGNNGAATNAANSSGAASVEIPTLVVLTGASSAADHNAASNNGSAGQTQGTSVNGSLKDVNNGELVNVNGTVEKAPAASVAKKQWGLSDEAARQLERDGAYIRATQVTTAAPGAAK